MARMVGLVTAFVGAFAGAFTGGVFGCAGELEGDPNDYIVAAPVTTAPSCGDTVDQVLTQRCSTDICHDSDEPAAALDLSQTTLNLIGVPSTDPNCSDRVLVDPAVPENSFLLEKIDTFSPECGSRMPLAGELESEEIACFVEWVNEMTGGGSGAPMGGADAGAPTGTDGGAP